MAGSNGSTAGTGYFDAEGRWITTQYDPHAAPGSNTRGADGAGGFGSTAESDLGMAPKPVSGADIPNYLANKAAAEQLAAEAFGWRPTASAVHAAPVTIDRSAENATNAMQMAQLARMQQAALGNGPSVANALGQSGYDATLKAQMAAGKGGGALGLRGVVGAGGAMHGDNAAKFAAMRAGEQQSGYGALAGAAFGTRGASLAGDIDQAKLSQQLAMTNAGADQAVALANQRAQMQAFGNQLGAAQTYGNLVQDAFGADVGYRDFLNKHSMLEQSKRDRKNQQTAAQVGQGISTASSVATLGMGSAGKSDPNAVKTGAK